MTSSLHLDKELHNLLIFELCLELDWEIKWCTVPDIKMHNHIFKCSSLKGVVRYHLSITAYTKVKDATVLYMDAMKVGEVHLKAAKYMLRGGDRSISSCIYMLPRLLNSWGCHGLAPSGCRLAGVYKGSKVILSSFTL
ncbi:hypothetical protein L1049_003814 [Liquidambar formosana]|uniref:Uncharacterized protein n=1 Tax=Liquidambar formosana TaxID=63359 RepID=A0AAP0RN20_LIQFO